MLKESEDEAPQEVAKSIIWLKRSIATLLEEQQEKGNRNFIDAYSAYSNTDILDRLLLEQIDQLKRMRNMPKTRVRYEHHATM
ncbi:hypothetical protein K3495_g9148 [Podosphaera aphanis]|nr:hypothetical protein K3495_g9148 [Podosphaera aphanis]